MGRMPEVESSQARVVLVTHPRAGVEEFAALLVGRGLAACVNLVDVTSIYRWQGSIEREPEVLLLIKTAADRIPEIERALAEEHPYEVPECVALAPREVERSYLLWLLTETRGL